MRRGEWDLSESRLQRETRWVWRIVLSLIGISAVLSLLWSALLIFGAYKAFILIEDAVRSKLPAPQEVARPLPDSPPAD